jgi:hypothetical protein
MKNGVYGIAGVYPDRTISDGVIDSERKVFDFLKGMKEGDKLKDLLDFFALKASTPNRISVTDITALTGEQLEALRCGDQVIKSDSSGEHCYIVSFKGATGRCLTYTDCENVETVAYEKTGDTWAYDSTDITHIGN